MTWLAENWIDPAPMAKIGFIGNGVMGEKVALYVEDYYSENLT